MERFKFLNKDKLNDLPKTTGVYCFCEKNKVIYIGKAINIKDRVKNHFNQPSYRDNLFINKVSKIGYFETGSEIEALILEANLIKKYQPKFNVIWRDDKNYFYVCVSQNENRVPYVFITHQPKNFQFSIFNFQSNSKSQFSNSKNIYVGPFVEGIALKKTLKFLRRAFPYYTTTLRRGSGQAIHSKNKCAYCHLNLCPGPEPDLNEYKKNIKKLILILKGKRGSVLNALKKEMKNFSKEKEFEKAGKTRDKIYALQQIMSHTHVINSGTKMAENFARAKFSATWAKTQKILKKIVNTNKDIKRIECYDVSNMQGKQATGSMVVFIDGKPDKNLYRKFHIKIEGKPNDVAMLREVLQRRLNHLEWTYPETMLIDGGKAQLNITIKTKNKTFPSYKRSLVQKTGFNNLNEIKILSIAKRNNKLYIEGKDKPILLKTLPKEIFNLILQLRDEAHRFAISYHKKLRKKYLLKY